MEKTCFLLLHLLQEAGDVVLAAGRPRERVGVGRDVGRHQLRRLVPLGAAGVPDAVVVHAKAVGRTGRGGGGGCGEMTCD